jgi:hypothetical protein
MNKHLVFLALSFAGTNAFATDEAPAQCMANCGYAFSSCIKAIGMGSDAGITICSEALVQCEKNCSFQQPAPASENQPFTLPQ